MNLLSGSMERMSGLFIPTSWLPVMMSGMEQLLRLSFEVPAVVASFAWEEIKEKFGSLRLHYAVDGDDPAAAELRPVIRGIVEAAKLQSHRTCYFCGRPESPRRDRAWVRTLCDDHADTDAESV